MARLGLILLALGLASCDGRPAPKELRFRVRGAPTRPVPAYGARVPVRFSLRNEMTDPVLLERVDGLVGRPRELARFREVLTLPSRIDGGALVVDPSVPERTQWIAARAVLLPGAEIEFTAEIRVLRPGEKLMIVAAPLARPEVLGKAWLPSAATRGRFDLATPAALDGFRPGPDPVLFPRDLRLPDTLSGGAEVLFPDPVPPAPFEPSLRTDAPWTWSAALGGYVFRTAPSVTRLVTREEVVPLPPVPLDFFDLLDAKGAIPVRLADGTDRRIGPGDVRAFLDQVLAQGREVTFGAGPGEPLYRVAE